jgi:hypothetical protein
MRPWRRRFHLQLSLIHNEVKRIVAIAERRAAPEQPAVQSLRERRIAQALHEHSCLAPSFRSLSGHETEAIVAAELLARLAARPFPTQGGESGVGEGCRQAYQGQQ